VKRTQIQLDEPTHAALRRLAYEQGTSMASIIRDTLARSLGTKAGRKPKRVRQYAFVGAGRSAQKARGPVSERHDEALAEALAQKTRR
jgi:hypothetical protein